MKGERAFLEAIRADPDEDGPRLVYADWLEEHGKPQRAQFIRLNCQMIRKRKVNVRDSRDADLVRMWELVDEYSETWLREMPSLPGVRWWCFWRGFPAIQ